MSYDDFGWWKTGSPCKTNHSTVTSRHEQEVLFVILSENIKISTSRPKPTYQDTLFPVWVLYENHVVFTAANTKNKLRLRHGALQSSRNVLMFRKNTRPVSAVKMLVARSSKMAVHLYQTTQPYFPRDLLYPYFMFSFFWILSINTSAQVTWHDVCVACFTVLRCLKILWYYNFSTAVDIAFNNAAFINT
jgi:hypothetical protein